MAAVANAKSVGGGFSNDRGIARVIYDFAADGGDTGALDLLTANEAIVITDFYAVVKTACTSGGSATIDVGISGGNTDALLDGVAVGDLGENSLHQIPLVEGEPNTRNDKLYLAAAEKIILTIAAQALTAGKIEFVFEYARA